MRDIYDDMPPEIGIAQRRHNLEELARLEREGEARRERIRRAMEAAQNQMANARSN